MLGQRSGRIILGNPEAGNATVIRMLQQPKGGAGYCDSLDILLQWNSAPFTAGDAIPLSIQIKGAGLVIRAFLSRFEIPRPRPSSNLKAGHHRGPKEIAQGLVNLTNCIESGEWQRRTVYKPPRVLIVLPPELDGDNTPYGDFFAGALAKTKAWGPVIEKAVRAAGAEYFDGGAVVGMPDQPDKVHLSAHEHELLGKAVAGKVREMMAR